MTVERFLALVLFLALLLLVVELWEEPRAVPRVGAAGVSVPTSAPGLEEPHPESVGQPRRSIAGSKGASAASRSLTGRVLDRRGRPVSGAEVVLVVQGEAVRLCGSGEQGRFDLPGPEEGSGAGLLAIERSLGVAWCDLAPAGAGREPVELVLGGGAELAGEARDVAGRPHVGMELHAVLESSDAAHLPGDDGGEGSDPAVLRSLLAGGGMQCGVTRVGSDGTFRFEGLLPGTYRISIPGRPWGTGFRGLHATGEHARIQDRLSLVVRAVDPAGRPVRGVRGAVRSAESPYLYERLAFDPSELLGSAPVPAGRHHVLVEAPGAEPWLTTVTIDEHAPLEPLVAELRYPGSAEVSIEDRPAAADRVWVATRILPPPHDDPGFGYLRDLTHRATLREGRASLRLPAGPWRWILLPSGEHPSPDDPRWTRIELSAGARVVLRPGG